MIIARVLVVGLLVVAGVQHLRSARTPSGFGIGLLCAATAVAWAVVWTV